MLSSDLLPPIFFDENPNNPLCLATVGSVNSAGVTLVLPGQTTPTQKRYSRIASASVASGDAVIIAKISGTYVVLGKLV